MKRKLWKNAISRNKKERGKEQRNGGRKEWEKKMDG